MFKWDSEQYLRFSKERTQPSIDLAARLTLENPKRMIDIGCGPGNSTAVLKARFPRADVLGVDSSVEMIQAASASYPDCRFALCDASSELSALGEGTFDVVFSNACIQWVPNHTQLIPQMFALLSPGGMLAVQIPINYNEPIHYIIEETASLPEWKNHFANTRTFYTLEYGDYFDILSRLTDNFALWTTTYMHSMPSHGAIMEWYKGTGLRPYLSCLNEADAASFEQLVFSRVVQEYPTRENGTVIFPFPRLFMTAIK